MICEKCGQTMSCLNQGGYKCNACRHMISPEEIDRIVDENERQRGHVRRDRYTLQLTREELAVVRDALLGYAKFLLAEAGSERCNLTHDLLTRVLQMEHEQ